MFQDSLGLRVGVYCGRVYLDYTAVGRRIFSQSKAPRQRRSLIKRPHRQDNKTKSSRKKEKPARNNNCRLQAETVLRIRLCVKFNAECACTHLKATVNTSRLKRRSTLIYILQHRLLRGGTPGMTALRGAQRHHQTTLNGPIVIIDGVRSMEWLHATGMEPALTTSQRPISPSIHPVYDGEITNTSIS